MEKFSHIKYEKEWFKKYKNRKQQLIWIGLIFAVGGLFFLQDVDHNNWITIIPFLITVSFSVFCFLTFFLHKPRNPYQQLLKLVNYPAGEISMSVEYGVNSDHTIATLFNGFESVTINVMGNRSNLEMQEIVLEKLLKAHGGFSKL